MLDIVGMSLSKQMWVATHIQYTILLCMSGLACRSYQALTWSKPRHHTSLRPLDSQHQFIRKLLCMLQTHSTWVVFAPATLQSSWNIWMHSFKVYGKWSVQASKQANIHTHVCNEVTLVWGSLRLAPISITIVQSCTKKHPKVVVRSSQHE